MSSAEKVISITMKEAKVDFVRVGATPSCNFYESTKCTRVYSTILFDTVSFYNLNGSEQIVCCPLALQQDRVAIICGVVCFLSFFFFFRAADC